MEIQSICYGKDLGQLVAQELGLLMDIRAAFVFLQMPLPLLDKGFLDRTSKPLDEPAYCIATQV